MTYLPNKYRAKLPKPIQDTTLIEPLIRSAIHTIFGDLPDSEVTALLQEQYSSNMPGEFDLDTNCVSYMWSDYTNTGSCSVSAVYVFDPSTMIADESNSRKSIQSSHKLVIEMVVVYKDDRGELDSVVSTQYYLVPASEVEPTIAMIAECYISDNVKNSVDRMLWAGKPKTTHKDKVSKILLDRALEHSASRPDFVSDVVNYFSQDKALFASLIAEVKDKLHQSVSDKPVPAESPAQPDTTNHNRG